jgi:sodium/hydrogen exchanger-like protein 6/7/sodium/hydrogen exchanger 8
MICESFIYIYLGVSIWNLKSSKIKEEEQAVSWTLILSEIIITFIARALALSILSLIAKLFKGKKWRLTLAELSIVWFAGLIRGSVAYALIQTLEPLNATDPIQVSNV